MNWADHLISYYAELKPPQKLPNDIQWLYPQQDPQTFKIVETFFHKFYNDNRSRRIFLGINPGRFGAGVTGVNFTAPRQLVDVCGIKHPFGQGTELSAEFIYDLIASYGGPERFYQDFFIGSVCPLGFVKNGRNLNYYDDPQLLMTLRPFIINNLDRLVSYPMDRTVCYCIGGEKNFRFLQSLNMEFQWFKNIEPLPHPRFIMQYRRKQKEQFIHQYLQLITKTSTGI